jgi:hypothetical protein
MASLQNIPYDLLLSIAQHLNLADICALQLVRNRRLNIPPTRFWSLTIPPVDVQATSLCCPHPPRLPGDGS